MVRCFDLLELPSIGGLCNKTGVGLDNEIKGINLLEITSDNKITAEESELVIVPSIVFREMTGKELFLLFVEKKISAVVICSADYNNYMNQDLKNLMVENGISVFVAEDNISFCDLIFDITQLFRTYSCFNEPNILDNIICCERKNEDFIISKAKFYKYDLQCPHYSFVVKLKLRKNENKQQLKKEIIAFSKKQFLALFDNILFTPYEDGFITLLPKTVSRENLEMIVERITKKYPVMYYGGIGNTYDSIAGFQNSIDEAKKIVRILSDVMHDNNSIRDFQYMFIYMLISQVGSDPMVCQFHKHTLAEIKNYDKVNASELQKTLRVYLEENQNAVVAADKLYIHRNTLKKRIKKIESLTNKSLDRLEDRFDLCLAIYIDDIMGANEKQIML